MSEPGETGRRTRGGLVFAVSADERPRRTFFLGADIAVKLAPRPQIARVPGSPPGLLGLALHDGAILPLLEVGRDRATMILCLYRGEQLGLVGAEDVESGVFTAEDGGGVQVDGKTIPAFDVGEIYARVHAVTWGTSWGG